MNPDDEQARANPDRIGGGLDALMRRYSRWKRERLVEIAELPLSALALRNLFLSVCILVDGVVLPWVVAVALGGFSFLLFTLLLIPAVALESVLYRRMKAPNKDRTKRMA